MEEKEDLKNATFEKIGNGSFIIEGQTTNLMDMESVALETVLKGSTDESIVASPNFAIKKTKNSSKVSLFFKKSQKQNYFIIYSTLFIC